MLFVGDFEYRQKLEEMAAETDFAGRIIFTGSMPREDLGVAYSVMNVFTFPSLKDTQGWVLHEAAHAGKPIVIIDKEVSEVVKDGVNGYFAEDTPESVAEKVISVLKSPKKQAEFSIESKKLASKFTERSQVKKLEKLYKNLIEIRENK